MKAKGPAGLPEEVRQQLRRLGVLRGSELRARSPQAPRRAAPGPQLTRVDTPLGPAALVETVYPTSYQHGRYPLRAFLQEPIDRLADLLTDAESVAWNAEGTVFVDIETTGLSDGAGTYAFLVGIGSFSGEHFHLQQVFLPSPAEERPFLALLTDLLGRASGLVTFNGRRFDLPILRTRFAVARMQPPWAGRPHLDLLPLARRFWRMRFSGCRLSALEEHLLGVERSSLDLLGWRVPSLYRAYLLGDPPEVLDPVFYHNAQDVLSLVTLAARLARLVADPQGEGGARHGLEWYALARLYEEQGAFGDAIAAYRAALLLALPLQVRERAWQRLANLLKRQGSWAEAVEIWESLIRRPGEHPLYAYVELAKYYEHQRKDLKRAEDVVRQAIAEHGPTPPGDDLGHRLERLRRKRAKRREKEDSIL